MYLDVVGKDLNLQSHTCYTLMLGLGNFTFVLAILISFSLLFALPVLRALFRCFGLPRGSSLFSLVCCRKFAVFIVYFVIIYQAEAMYFTLNRATVLLACAEVGAMRSIARSSSMTTSLTDTPNHLVSFSSFNTVFGPTDGTSAI